MRFDILTLFPELIQSHLDFSIMKRAKEDGIIEVNTINPRDYTLDKHKKVDDTPYGGGAGMVLTPQPYVDAYEGVNKENNFITLMMTPQGEPFTHEISKELAQYDQVIILCGHYEGFDERIISSIVEEEISIGDYVLTGGEMPAAVLVDCISRMIPGVLPEAECYENESIASGILEYPQYTRPRNFEGMEVPEILFSGHHANIEKWRRDQSEEITRRKRPDLLKK